jgi:threonine/homoserine/homoserine lactone efflux protein
MHNELLWVFIVVFAIDSIVPGPAVAMVMSRGASVGLIRTIPFIAGLVVGDLFLFLFALLGLAALAVTLGPLFLVVKWLGVCYLLYLAYTTWNAKPEKLALVQVEGEGSRSFCLAIILPLGNPRAVGFYVALLPAFLDISTLTFATALHFSIVIVVIWSAALVFYTTLADIGRRFFANTNMQLWLNRSAAGAMVGAAGTIALRE